jgi:hypothetical protein
MGKGQKCHGNQLYLRAFDACLETRKENTNTANGICPSAAHCIEYMHFSLMNSDGRKKEPQVNGRHH